MESGGPPGGYPSNPAFAAALKQARERAAGFTRSRQQASAPDPPDSNDKAKDSKGGNGGTPAPSASNTPAAADRLNAERAAAAVAERAAVAAERAAVERSAAGAAALYGHLPMQGRLAMGLGGGGNLLHQLQLTEAHNRLAFEQRQREREALMLAARPGWATHPAAAAAAAAEEKYRIAQGLPPLGVNPLMAARGLHPGFHPLGRVPIPGAHLPLGAEAELRAAEFAERQAALEAAAAGETAAAAEPADAAPSGPNAASAIDLLAAAAEDTLRSEEREKGSDSEDADAKPASEPVSNGSATKPKEKEKPGRRKRKGANEPKNPLGAFVFYQRKIMADVFEENPCITFGEAAAECGRRWRLLPSEAKEEFRQMAADDKARYTRELASYKNKSEGDPVASKPAAVKTKTPVRRKRQEGVDKSKPEPKRPKSALLYFKAEEIPRVMKEYPNVTQKEAATEAAARYKALSKASKEKFEKLASDDKKRYQQELRERNGSDEVDPPLPRTRNGKAEDAPGSQAVEEVQTPEDVETEKDINGWCPSAVQVQTSVTYDEMRDPNPYYVEEEAWRYHNPPIPPTKAIPEGEQQKVQQFPYVTHEELRPLPPPPPLPTAFPNTPFCRWSYDEDTRVLYADFRRATGEVVVTLEDEKFLLEMYERDDITVISEGLVSGLDKEKWTLDYISRVAGDEYYHRFRRFDKQTAADVAAKTKRKPTKKSKTSASNEHDDAPEKFVAVAHAEVDKMLSMKVKDFVNYLRRRGTALATLHHTTPSEEEKAALCTYTFPDHAGTHHTVDVIESSLYMLDYDMVKLLPTLYEDFHSCFKLKDCLPGGSHCMMNCVTSNGRPFMGPNLYVAPPGAFTHFHQDGHGTVDSGHYCLSGFNEVVITRRLTERSKRHALRLLTGGYRHPKGSSFEGLYDLPHADNLGDKPQWPDKEAIARCNEMNYCVSRFILKPGQMVHINKGRLHAFRKVTNERLPPNDCHAELREQLLVPGTNERVVGSGLEILCISVAWDWMYRGVTAKGINREIVSILECAALNRKYGAMSLAIPELSLIAMSRTLAPKPDEKTAPPGAYRESLVGFEDYAAHNYGITTKGFMPSASTICKGIFPSLQYVVKQHIYAINVAESLKSKSFERGKRVSVAARPNAWENPVTHPLDPYGNSDFFCKLCNKELSNVYLHCDGCELLLSKDFNICLECYQEKRYATSVQMHPLNNKRHSTINHIGNFTFDRASRCPCKNGPVCRHCNYCAGCSCRCHSWFTLYFRFFKKNEELKLLHRVKRLVGREELDAAEEAEKRLSMVIRGRYSEEGEGGPFGLHNMDVMVSDEELVEEREEEDRSPAAPDAEEEAPVVRQPKRKSRRNLPQASKKDVDEIMADAEDDPTSHIDRTNKNDMQVGVSDMKVTIRYRSCEWTQEERDTIQQALKEEKDWEGIVAKLPDRGIDQIRKFATATYPALVEALEKPSAEDKMDDVVPQSERPDEDKMEVDEAGAGPKPDEPMESDKADQEDSKEPGEGAKKDENEEPKNDAPTTSNGEKAKAVESATDLKNDDSKSSTGSASASAPAKVQEEEVTTKEEQTTAKEEAAVKEEEKAEPKEEETVQENVEEKKSETGEAEPVEGAAASTKKARRGSEKLPPANQGRWSDEERERLRVALLNEKDLDGVERYVGTRRMAAIRSFAPRTFPELYQELRDRVHKPVDGSGGKKERRRSSAVKSEKAAEKTRKPDPDEVIEGEESTGPATRRRSSRRGSQRKSAVESEAKTAKIKQEDDSEATEEEAHDNKMASKEEHDDESTEAEEYDDASDDGKSPSKLGALNRARKQSMRQASQAANGRGRRSTQDLSGGRKRRNSGAAARSTDADGSDTSEDEAIGVAGQRKKRVKQED